jgi:hypothetical protein
MGFSPIRQAVIDLAAGVLELHEAGRKADEEVHDLKGGSYRARTHRAGF